MGSFRKTAEQRTDTTGSRYPRMATVWTGRDPMPLKYRQ